MCLMFFHGSIEIRNSNAIYESIRSQNYYFFGEMFTRRLILEIVLVCELNLLDLKFECRQSIFVKRFNALS